MEDTIYNLPPVWDNIIKKRVKAEAGGRFGGGACYHYFVQHPQQHLWDKRTNEVDRSKRKLFCK